MIHSPRLRIPMHMICGYHVFGTPMPHWMDHPGIQYVDPENSGLETVPGGTSCDTCVFYEGRSRDKGVCYGVAKSNDFPPAPVHARGCCARWEDK